MKAADFDYLRPGGLSEAIAMMADEGAMALAGGQSLMAMMNFRIAAPDMLVDLNGLAELSGIEMADGMLRIGAMTRWSELMESGEVARHAPLMAAALPHVAHDAVRNRGTIGGSLALADPAAEMPAVALALGARIEAAGPDGSRMIEAHEFFLGTYETALAPGELIVAAHLPAARAGDAFGFHELTQRHGDYALAGAALARMDGAIRVALFGVSDRALRAAGVEAALAEAPDDVGAALAGLDGIEFNGDLKASAATRRRLAGVAIRRALEAMA